MCIRNGLKQLVSIFIGKDYTLLHQAPIVSVFILDHVGLPLASLYEVDNEIVPRKPHPIL